MAEITALNIYPVKALGGIALESVELTGEGLALDRRWMVTTESGRFITQRELPIMATIEVHLDTYHLILCAPDRRHLFVPLSRPTGPAEPLKIFRDHCAGVDEGDEAAAWLTDVLGLWHGETLRLKRVPEDNHRLVDPQRLGSLEARTGFADGFPLLIATCESLEDLNARLRTHHHRPVPMSRFRPNIVLAGVEAFAEHYHQRLEGRDFVLWLCKPCQRCRVTTVDQCSGEIVEEGEPLATLMGYHHVGRSGAFFGENAVVLEGSGARLSVGDRVELTAPGEAAAHVVVDASAG
ncbi:MOSC domain-containing protein [Kushneria phosphatilytica]|uniref:MOSC domain-containing protein n=1 Tax=Kushneria phosphatilytica TaxID=657387 RepID=A0A1S1NY12_9GAMM|nr:MOSC N-terminal beta barrel domain-containing protein [Kushneria phosphatilytica]OHV09924.1 hypothetical protein BH688_09865 [Kushneria phosphatilytica]QEL11591.1 MOSC domain-containing protein [Kushneria phosphatilytica]